jgi:hypothetical protein
MYGTQTSTLMILYLAGLFGFGLYSVMGLANPSVLSALEYGAQWPVLVLQMM